jgi:uncharacterized membrane protein YgaE (UPF0421/DUF939 family)
MTLSTKAKESIKTALAMTIAYAIALSMDWDKPYWAGFAVAFISLASIGQSLNKAALRMFGTLLAVVVSLTLIALFAQDRWAFMLCLSLVTGFCCYMMGGIKHKYFWQATGFVCIIICMDAGADSVNAFNIAVLRAQQTGLGILVYSLVAIFLWPSSSRSRFYATVVNLASTQHQLYSAYFAMACGRGDDEAASRLKTQEVQAKTSFDQLLNAALADSHSVWELKDAWRHYQAQAAELMVALYHWQAGFAEVQSLDLYRLFPDLEVFDAELEARLTQIDQMLADHPPERLPQTLTLSFDNDALRSLSHFDRAAFAVVRSHMQHLERLTRSLFDSVRAVKGLGETVILVDAPSKPNAVFLPDPDRLANTCRFMTVLWLAFLALVYVADVPGGAGLVSMCGAFGIALANMPQIPVSKLFKPAATSVLFAGLLYIFVMPKLSSFIGLGLLIFATTFAICYLFAAPQQGLGRALGLAMFVTIASISNEQSYSFLTVSTTALMYPVLFLIMTVTAIIPFYLQAEAVALRLLGRFFRSSEYLMSVMSWESPQAATRLERWRRAFHAREVATLPTKLGSWLPHVDTGALAGTSPKELQALVNSMQSLTYRMQQLLEEHGVPQAKTLVQELREDFRTWRLEMQSFFLNLSENPAVGDWKALRVRIDGIMADLEGRIKEGLDKTGDSQLNEQEAVNFYILLGACRGVSEALVDYAGSADAIDWAGWREERF